MKRATSPRAGAGGTLGRRLAYRLQRHLLGTEFLVAREDRFGLRFRFKVEDAIGRCIYQNGVYEEALTRYLVRDLELRKGDVVLDVGANIGWFSALLDRVAPRGVTIYAFEPEPLNYELLVENLERNRASAVEPVRTALDEREGCRPLFLYPDKNRGRHSFLETEDAAGSVEVPTTTLDRFWRRRGLDGRPVGLLKVDVEGFEHQVLAGAEEVLRRCRVVVTEFVPELIQRTGMAPECLPGHLCASGFRPHRPTTGGLRPLEPASIDGRAEPLNVVWTREEGG